MRQTVAVETFHNMEQLINVLTSLAKQVALTHPSEILPVLATRVVLIEETLTDGSKVFNFELV